MLTKDRKERLGQKMDVDEILGHPWFSDIDIGAILKKSLPAPFVPVIKGKKDLSNFDPELLGRGLKESILPQEKIDIIKERKDAFKDFGPILNSEVAD
jgi:hypothetical protein